jgi:Protein of unknown function (DUF3106)
MRINYISALVATLLLSAPVWAGMHQAGRPSGAGVQYGRPSGAGVQYGRPSGAGAPPGFAPRPQYAAPGAPQFTRPHQFVRGAGPHNGEWLRNTMQLPPQERLRRLEHDQHFRQLPQQRQEQLRNRLQTFNSMPPQEQQRVLNRIEMIEHLRPEQQAQAHMLFGQFRAMDPQRKDMIRRTLRQMRTMPPNARERLLDSPETQSRYSPQDILILRGFNSIGFVGPDQ